jgi:hypothetical protein
VESVTCITAREFIATGSGNDTVRTYRVDGTSIDLIVTTTVGDDPITSIIFCRNALVVSSAELVSCIDVLANRVYAVHQSDDPILSLASIE